MAFPLIQANSKEWSREEERQLKQLARHNRAAMLSLILGRPESAVRAKAAQLHVRLRQ